MIEFFEHITTTYQEYLILLIIVFGILHPLTENPWSLFTLGIAIPILGIPLAYLVILGSNLLGSILLYVIIHTMHKKKDYILQSKKYIGGALEWIATTPMYKHIIVIGLPTVPTYPIKVALPLSKLSFQRYLITIFGSYLFLILANSLLYFGVLGTIDNVIPTWVGAILLIVFAVMIYASGTIRNKIKQIQT
jgi:uncharacterized membrane protein YdjX (TVP38/TMEM64 family)